MLAQLCKSSFRVLRTCSQLQFCAGSLAGLISERFTCSKCPKLKTNCQPAKKKITCKLFTYDAHAEAKNNTPKTKKSVWPETPECCYNFCDLPARYDELYYLPSDPHQRLYNKTWVDCPKVKYEKVCPEIPDEVYAKPEYRKKKRQRKCQISETPNDLMVCHKPIVKTCIKLSEANCRLARNPPKCSRSRLKSCEKVNSPWPSYSECEKLAQPRRNARECDCISKISLCDIMRVRAARRSCKQ